MKAKLKVFYGVNESGVNYWRGKVPGWALQRKGNLDVRMLDIFRHTDADAAELVGNADVMFIPSATGIQSVVECVKYVNSGKGVVLDYDDNLFDCHPFNPGYATLGLSEVKCNINGQEGYLWQDGRNGFSLKDNGQRYLAHIDLLHIATLVTTTTPTLKNEMCEYMKRPSDEVIPIQNAIDFNTFKSFGPNNNKKIRIGWTASDSHILEGQFVMRMVAELKRRRSDFEFVILGNIEKFRQSSAGMDIEFHEFVDLYVYPLKLASLKLDIGVCPLEDRSFNRCKSALKWSEYSALRIPSVCSDLEPYKVVRHGIDGLLAKDPIDFVDKLEELMDNHKLRESIACEAYDRNFREFNIDVVCDRWAEVLERAYINRGRQVQYQGVDITMPNPNVKTLENVEVTNART